MGQADSGSTNDSALMRPLLSYEAERWVTLPGGADYDRASCETVDEGPLKLLITYSSEAAPQRAGLRRSKVAIC